MRSGEIVPKSGRCNDRGRHRPVTHSVVLVADAGEEAGLGHVSRASAVAVALRCRGIATRSLALGVSEQFECDGVTWAPLRDGLPTGDDEVLVVDSYRLPPDELARAARSARVVVMHDYGLVPDGVSLVVTATAQPSGSAADRLSGLEYAALRPGFWGLPKRELANDVRRVLVTVGSGRLGEVGAELARAAAEALPDSRVTMVRGPHASVAAPAGIETLDAPASLLEPLLSADLVITAGGQTMLEAAAAGTPSLALALADNQCRQALRLSEVGAARLVGNLDPDQVATTVSELAADRAARVALSRRGQQAVDGFGALRVAFRIARLAQDAG
jgi:UDP-2,4-diacetamido-2,4,6-trideoxy-beta-L-altropyranose hydrolase